MPGEHLKKETAPHPAHTAPELPRGNRSNIEISKAARAVMQKVLPAYTTCTQTQWAEDKVTSRMTGETHYVERAERAFVLQGFATDLAAIELGRPRLREIFPASGPTVPSELPDFARELFSDANHGGMFSRAGRIETGVAQRRIRYSERELGGALEAIRKDLDLADFETLQVGMDMLTGKNG